MKNGLENRRRGNSSEGSNPSPSAKTAHNSLKIQHNASSPSEPVCWFSLRNKRNERQEKRAGLAQKLAQRGRKAWPVCSVVVA